MLNVHKEYLCFRFRLSLKIHLEIKYQHYKRIKGTDLKIDWIWHLLYSKVGPITPTSIFNNRCHIQYILRSVIKGQWQQMFLLSYLKERLKLFIKSDELSAILD